MGNPADAPKLQAYLEDEAFNAGVDAERAAIVAWLRKESRYSNPHNLDEVADVIEREGHLRGHVL